MATTTISSHSHHQVLYQELPPKHTIEIHMAMVIFKAMEEDGTQKHLFLKFAAEEGPRFGKWHLPGGIFDEGVRPIDILIVKVHSLLKYTLDPEKVISTFEGYTVINSEENRCAKAHVFELEVPSTFNPTLNEKHSEYKWLSWDKAKEKLSFMKPDFYEAIFDSRV